jgi:inositol oxygenase
MTESIETVPSTISTTNTNHIYRNYQEGTPVANFYNRNHIGQTYEHVQKVRSQVLPIGQWKLDILEVIRLLDEIIDESDPDTQQPQIIHAIQTGEACRKARPNDDWFHLTGFIHDLGKILAHPTMHNLPQWSVTGDTFPVGCAFDSVNIHFSYFQDNSDSSHEVYSTKNGIYEEGCGFDNVTMSFGHDEYMYQVLKGNNTLLPDEALYLIRYHSFYPWHQSEGYSHLASKRDWELLPLQRQFQKCDLYSKKPETLDVEVLSSYYEGLIKKYFPETKLLW